MIMQSSSQSLTRVHQHVGALSHTQLRRVGINDFRRPRNVARWVHETEPVKRQTMRESTL